MVTVPMGYCAKLVKACRIYVKSLCINSNYSNYTIACFNPFFKCYLMKFSIILLFAIKVNVIVTKRQKLPCSQQIDCLMGQNPLSTSHNSEHGSSRMSIHPIFTPFASWISVCQFLKIDCQRFFRIGGLSERLDLRNIKQKTAAMPLEGGETNHLQIGVDLRAVVNDL